MMTPDERLRHEVREVLVGNQAHLSLEHALAGLPPDLRERAAPGHKSVWDLLEHMRLAQQDILRYTRDQRQPSPPWPEGYWPAPGSYSPARWDETVLGWQQDLREALEWLDDPALDLLALLPDGEGRSYLRQFLLIADHNAYHLGQIVAVRRVLGDWPEG